MKLLHFLYACLFIGVSVSGQDIKSTPPAQSVIDFRPIGEMRLWTFVSRDSTLGHLISTMKEKSTVNGREGLLIEQELEVDLSMIGGQPMAKTSARRWVSPEGFYLGEETKFVVDNESNELKLEVEGNRLSGYFTRAGDKLEQELAWPTDRFAFDPYLADELELYFAHRGLAVGDTFEDTTFSPATMLFSPMTGTVDNFVYTELYKGHFDSVYVVRLKQPEEYTLLIRPDYRLVRMDYPGVRLRAYLDRVVAPQAPNAGAPTVPKRITPLMLIMRLSHWLVYTIVGAAVLLFFVRRQYKPWPNWIGLLSGCVAYLVVILLQFPVQEWMINEWVGPRVGIGDSVLLLGAIPSLFAGVLQQALIFGMIVLVSRRYHPSKDRLPLIGAFVGAGFAIAEAYYQTIPGALIGWQMFERPFMLLLHIAGGYLIGYLYASGKGIWVGLVLLIAADSIVRYLPMLLPQRLVSIPAVHFVLAFVALFIAASAILTGRRPIPAGTSPRASKAPSSQNPLS